MIRIPRMSLSDSRQLLPMQSSPLVSIVIICFNGVEFLQEAIDSALAQTYTHWELFIVDDGSSDGSDEIARNYASRDSARIHYLEHDGHKNLGMSASRNLGIRCAKGEYLAFLDADDYWLPEKLETHVRMLNDQPNVGMLYGTAKYWYSWTGRAEDKARDFVPELRTRGNILFDPPELLPMLLNGKAEVPCTCSLLVRRELVQKIGGFEESFRGMYEDQVFYAKVCLSTPVLATDDCLAWYRQHPKSHSSVIVKSGKLISTQYSFLQWLETYCSKTNVTDRNVLQTIRRKLWLNRQSTHQFPLALTPRAIFWVKKWLLKAEEHLLPSIIREWIWTHR